MRLGILGPAHGDFVALARAAQHLLDEVHAERVIYVAEDRALERIVFDWARQIVGENPTAEALFKRAAVRCATATPAEIDRFVECERARLRLNVLLSLPRESNRSIQRLDGRVVLFLYDKSMLNEEDIASASILVFGKGSEPLIRKLGDHLFISPGPIGSPTGGSALLDDSAGGVAIDIINASGIVTAHEHLGNDFPGNARIQGEP